MARRYALGAPRQASRRSCTGRKRNEPLQLPRCLPVQTLLGQPEIDPVDLVPAIASALRANAALAPLLDAADVDCGERLRHASAALDHPLLRRLMTLTVIYDAVFESFFTRARAALLRDGALRRDVPLRFLTALAQQCFLVEYLYADSPAETTAVGALAQEIAAGIISPDSVAMLACYRPLGREPFAEELSRHPELSAIADVIARQVTEPVEEATLAATLPSLAPIADDLSLQVRAQYEENPYPRWCRAGLPDPVPFARAIRELFPDARLGAELRVEAPRILVAGCGTGKHAILTARRYADARVTAVDLSRASLAHGARQARELGVANIDFVQGDILDLGGLEPGLDLVESFGVLHHLREPMAGWRVLVDLLRPGGLMMIGLYSELARRPVVEARRFIAERGYAPTLTGIRQFRADLRAGGEARLRQTLEQSVDFYSASGCRDLLFHVQEHRYTVPMIESAVRTLGLEFIGFELHDATVLARYRERFPDDPGASTLAHWDAFEHEHPETFAESYKFWLRKPDRGIE